MLWYVVRSDQPKPSEPAAAAASYGGPNQLVRAYRVWHGERPGRKSAGWTGRTERVWNAFAAQSLIDYIAA